MVAEGLPLEQEDPPAGGAAEWALAEPPGGRPMARGQWAEAMLREMFPTPTMLGALTCTALSVARVKPRSWLGLAGALAGGAALFGALRGAELLRWLFHQELAQLREQQHQKSAFINGVIAALDIGRVMVPEELTPLQAPFPPGAHLPAGTMYEYVYRAPGCTPLWFRCPPTEGAGAVGLVGPSHDWEWSPDRRVWVPMDTLTVPAGEWEGQQPSASNQVFIQRLRALSALSMRPAGRAGRRAPHAPPPLSLPPNTRDALGAEEDAYDDAPPAFLCPISFALMLDPVVSPSGVTYERASIEAWLARHRLEPATNRRLLPSELYPNLALRAQIEAWAAERQAAHAAAE